MMRPFEHFEELRVLLDALCEETIGAEQVRRLEELVLAHPEAEAYYVQSMSLHADLLDHFRVLPLRLPAALRENGAADHKGVAAREERGVRSEEIAPISSLLPPPSSLVNRRRTRLGGFFVLAALAAALVVALLLTREKTPSGGDLAAGAAGEPLDDSVAVLLHAPGADWGDTNPPPRIGAPLPPGRLRLKSGLAHLEFYSGATVILEGPADLQLISPSEAYCTEGKLRATVPPQAAGFTIATPKLDLVDRGTEFGLRVNPNRTEVHVFQGKVELYDAGTDHAGGPGKELTTGLGLCWEAPGAARSIASDSAAFLTARDLAARIKAAMRRRQRDWLAASAALRRYPSLVVYYPFQPERSWSRTLRDETAGEEPRHDGTIVGCSWGPGRWPGKQGLEFKQISDRVRLHVPGNFDALTMAAWVRVDALPNRFNSLMMTDGGEEAAPHWHIGSNGKIELGVQSNDRKKGWVHYYSPKVFTPDRLGRWTHLAVVYDRTNGVVAHYIDGQTIEEQPLQVDIALRIGDAEIGNWNVGPRRHFQPIRYFRGCIDEFMLFGRALPAEEIQRLFDQGRPPT
ncbi:MAG TPA: LamG-like jellyroll fold domain-containing protein [Gemmataceae bacterium]|jgi:hypothetical protein